MNNLVENPTGIDKAIAKLQTRIYSVLSALGTVEGYGRVYRNKRNNEFVFEVYKGNNEYEDVTGLDGSNFFFYVDEDVDLEDAPTANVSVMFFLNLNNFYPSATKRMDEEIKEKLVYELDRPPFATSRMVSGPEFVDNILKGYFTGKTVSHRDMHPYHIFTIQGLVTFNYKSCA